MVYLWGGEKDKPRDKIFSCWSVFALFPLNEINNYSDILDTLIYQNCLNK